MDEVFEHEIQVRYRDLDTYGHVNNAVYATYCEEARAAWAEAAFDLTDMDEFSAVVASFGIDYRRSVTGRGTLTVETRVTNVGRSSYELSYRLHDDGEVVAEGESTQVYVDPATRESRPLPDDWRATLESVARPD